MEAQHGCTATRATMASTAGHLFYIVHCRVQFMNSALVLDDGQRSAMDWTHLTT